MLAVACDADGRGVELWDLQTKRRRTIGVDGSRCLAVTFLPAGTTLAIVTCNTLIIHDIADGRQRQVELTGPRSEVFAAPIGDILVVGGGITEVWRPSQMKFLFRPPMSRSLSISPDGKMLAISRRDAVYICDLPRQKAAAKCTTVGTGIVGFLPDGRLAVACGNQVQLVNPTNGVALSQRFASPVALTAVTLSPSGLLAAGGCDGSVTVWDTKTGAQQGYKLCSQENRPLAALAFAMLGAWLLVFTTTIIVHAWGRKRDGKSRANPRDSDT
jgi:WD40 repeat protein